MRNLRQQARMANAAPSPESILDDAFWMRGNFRGDRSNAQGWGNLMAQVEDDADLFADDYDDILLDESREIMLDDEEPPSFVGESFDED